VQFHQWSISKYPIWSKWEYPIRQMEQRKTPRCPLPEVASFIAHIFLLKLFFSFYISRQRSANLSIKSAAVIIQRHTYGFTFNQTLLFSNVHWVLPGPTNENFWVYWNRIFIGHAVNTETVSTVACWSCGRALDLWLTGHGFKTGRLLNRVPASAGGKDGILTSVGW